MNREKLFRLHERLVEERARILADPSAHAAGDRLPPQLIRELADIDSATRAVAAELDRHTPKVGYGSDAAELAQHIPPASSESEMDHDGLLRLHERLVEERARILADPSAHAAGDRLPPQLIRELADIDSATRAVAAELDRHTPKVGYGSET
jgi:hypothetical protein